MRQWFSDLLAKNRVIGPRPSGLCLWQNLDELVQLSRTLVSSEKVREASWDELNEVLKGRTGAATKTIGG